MKIKTNESTAHNDKVLLQVGHDVEAIGISSLLGSSYRLDE